MKPNLYVPILLLIAVSHPALAQPAVRLAAHTRPGSEASSVLTTDSLYSKDIFFLYRLSQGTHQPRQESPLTQERPVIRIYLEGDTTKRESIRQLYYYPASATNKVIRELSRTHEVRDAFIEELDLQQVSKWFQEHYYPDTPKFPLKFYNCYIKRLISDSTSEQMVEFGQPLHFEEVSVGFGWLSVKCPRMEFVNSDLRNTLFVNSEFGKFHFSRTYAAQNVRAGQFSNYEVFDPSALKRYGITFTDCQFGDSSFFCFTVLEKVEFEHCEFSGFTRFAPNPYFQRKALEHLRQLARREGAPVQQIYQLRGTLPDKYNPYVLSQFSFNNSTFCRVSFADMVLDACQFNNTRFRQSLDLSRTKVRRSWNDPTTGRPGTGTLSRLNRCHFDEGTVLSIDVRNQSIDSLYLSLTSLRRVKFDLKISPDSMSAHDHDHVDVFFNGIENYVKYVLNTKEDDRAQKEAVLDYMNYQRKQYQRHYEWNSSRQEWAGFSGTVHTREYLKLWFLEGTVRNGYNGEWQFLQICLLLILSFAFIYWLTPLAQFHLRDKAGRFQNPVVKLVLNTNGTRQGWRILTDFLVCLWFSFVLFVGVKFPPKYFELKPALFVLVCSEWLVGLTMIVLFLLHVAAKLPVVHTLLGI